MRQRIPAAITGVGCICGAGGTLGECIETLFEGRRNPLPPLRFTSTHGVRYPVFEVPEAAIHPELKNTDHISLTSKLAITAAYEAFIDAGLEIHEVKGKKVGVCIGTTVGSVMNDLPFYAEFHKGGTPEIGAINRFLRSNPSALIAREFGLTGPCQTVVNACSSSTDAIGIGASWIQSGRCEMVIAGGADELSLVTYNGFISMMIADENPCKPFDRDRKGLNLGEGSAILILESEHSWVQRHKTPRAIVLGYGSSSDAHHLTAPHPHGEGLKRALIEAMSFSGAKPDEIAFVNAHGTGTPDNDRVESKVLSELLPGVPFVSTKGYTGHTLGAAGAIEAAFTVACLERSMIPGNAGFANPDPDLPATPAKTPTVVKGSMAISQSLAFGGCNGVLIIGNRGDDVEAFVQGIGIVGGFGTGMEAFSSTLATGLSEIQAVTVQTPDGAKEMPAFLADTSGLEAFVEKKTLRRMDHYSRMALLGAYLALENAGTLNIDRRSLGIVVASGYGASRSTCAFLDSFIEGNDAFSSPTHFSNSVHNAAAANISITLGVTGPCLTVSQFEMSVPSALISAIEWLKEGRVEKVLFGAVDEYSDILGYCWYRFHGYQRGIVVDPFLFHEQTAILGEGSVFFLLSLEQGTGSSYGRIEDVNTQCTDGFECPEADQTLFILGADGHKSWGQQYERYVTKNIRIASYTPLYGSFPTNMAFDMAAAFSSFRIGKIYAPPAGISCPSSLNIIREEQPLDVEKICCLKCASKGESGAITITHG